MQNPSPENGTKMTAEKQKPNKKNQLKLEKTRRRRTLSPDQRGPPDMRKKNVLFFLFKHLIRFTYCSKIFKTPYLEKLIMQHLVICIYGFEHIELFLRVVKLG